MEVTRFLPWRRFIGRGLLLAALGVAACLAVVLGCLEDPEVDPKVAVDVLLSEHRPFVVRLSPNATHHSCQEAPPRCVAPWTPDAPELADLVALTARLARSGTRAVTPTARARALHLRGLVALVVAARSGDAAPALAWLQEAVDLAPEEPRLVADLAAARLVHADLGGDTYSRFLALVLLDRALELEPTLSAARFNRALVLESLGLRAEAAGTWVRIHAEGEPGWAEEAHRRSRSLAEPMDRERWAVLLDRLEQDPIPSSTFLRRMAGDHPQQTRLHVQDVVLPAWGTAITRGNGPAAERWLDIARGLVGGLASAGNGQILANTLERLTALAPKEKADAALAFQRYGTARLLHERGDYKGAAPGFREASDTLGRLGASFVAWPRFYLAVERNYEASPDLDEIFRAHWSILSKYGASDPVVFAHAHWMLGYTRMFQGRWGDAVEHYEIAHGRFSTLGELENANAMESLLAEMWRKIGDRERAWEWHGRALANLHRLHKSRRIQNVLDAVIDELREEERPDLALHFAEQWVVEAARRGNEVSRSLALAERARLRAHAGRVDEAEKDAARALAAVEGIPATGLRSLTRADVLLTLSEVYVEAGAPAEALAAVRRVLEMEGGDEAGARLRIEALECRAALHSRSGDGASALADLDAAQEEILRQRSSLDIPSWRVAFLDRVRRVLERKVELLAEEGAWEEAFWSTDQFRAWEVREALGAGTSMTSSARRPTPAPGTAVLAFLSLRDRLLAWSWIDGELQGRVVLLSRGALTAATASLWSELEGEELAGSAARFLGERLIPPDLGPEVRDLVVLPDGPLHRLPFAALALPDGSLVAERMSVGVLPSLEVDRLLAVPWDRSQERTSLLVADVEHSHEKFPGLAPLRAGSVDTIRPLLGTSSLLTGREATPSRFLSELPRHDTVVFFGHGLASDPSSEQGGLVLAPEEPSDDGVLWASKLEGLERIRTRFVFLASCSGADGRPSLSEGPLSLVHALLSAGIPQVVANLGPARSDTTEDLLTEYFRAGDSHPAQAFREAQLAVMDADPGVLGFQIYGGTRGAIAWPSLQPEGGQRPTKETP